MNVEQAVIDVMKQCGIDTVLTLPCDRMKNFLPLIPKNFREIPLSREEGGVGIAAGLYMSGKKPAMVIQSTGIGNSLTALSSLHKTYDLPLPILASWRGVYKESIQAQVHFGKFLPGVLDNMGIPYLVAEKPADLPAVRKAIDQSYKENTPYVILFSPKIWEGSTAKEAESAPQPQERSFDLNCSTRMPRATETRFDMIKAIVPYLRGKIVVSNIGVPSKELYAALDQPTNFYMTGSWGEVSAIGNGLAIGQQKEVVVLDGDGSILFNPNTLGMIAQESPENLTVIAFDNSAHGSTGNQPTYSSRMDLELLARVYGIGNTTKAATAKELLSALEKAGKGPRFIHVPVLAKNADVPNIPLSNVDIKKRFMEAI
ncbi:sulfopyruvate decarboxylase, alpha chain [Methanocella arvoryzae MRE50]|uniref:sulfopyruvate decarboxylase n=2 Tax=Methanocella TaxID=570266 RepID=Q0W895_METAR|nr:sulfopyruvate decarboxylase, alpha chain [Methanocella arvoryzae MRE50]